MFVDDRNNTPKALNIYLKVEQYPILRHEILEQMRKELFQRGVVTHDRFEAEIEEKAISSQRLEGLVDPYAQETNALWQERLTHIRNQLTMYYFAYNVPDTVFDGIVQRLIGERTGQLQEIPMTFNPELAPLDLLFQQGSKLEQAPEELRGPAAHHMQEMRVVIIKAIISDQLAFIKRAKKWFTFEDLRNIRARRIGRGKIGGKAAGVLLALKILQSHPEIAAQIKAPESYFIGTDVFNEFKYTNRLQHVSNQKYKDPDDIRQEYEEIRARFAAGTLPQRVVDELRNLLERLGNVPLVVRSSSLLEDSFGTSFAGKYESFFCASQGPLDERLNELTWAITQVYASVYNPDALFYRREKDLLDYDERMAILLQVVEGEHRGDYFFPDLAGVGFSHNPFKWTEKIDSDAGFLRVVWGLGTRAVDRGAEDYPRMLALSHPTLRPEMQASDQQRYSQHLIDLINLKTNQLETQRVEEVLKVDMRDARYILSRDRGGYLQRMMLHDPSIPTSELVLTFEPLIDSSNFVPLMRKMLDVLRAEYETPVDIEFTGDIIANGGRPQVRVCLVQCRPQSYRAEHQVKLPRQVAAEDTLFYVQHKLIPSGVVHDIAYTVYVDPRMYYEAGPDTRLAIARAVGRLNDALASERFVLIGPNRWGSNNPELGVKVSYADIHNTLMLIEEAFGPRRGPGTPQPSHGTHFYQDLVESNIFPLAIYPNEASTVWLTEHLYANNQLGKLLPGDAWLSKHIYVAHLPANAKGKRMSVMMDGQRGEAIGFLNDDSAEPVRGDFDFSA